MHELRYPWLLAIACLAVTGACRSAPTEVPAHASAAPDPVHASAAPDAVHAGAAPDAAPEDVVRGDVAALSRGDLEGFLALYAPDAKIFGLPTDPHVLVGPWWQHMAGKDKLRAYFEKSLFKRPLPRLVVLDTVTLADLVAAHVRITDPPGYDTATDVLAVYRVRAGLIEDLWHVTRDAPPGAPAGQRPDQVLRDLMAAGNRVDVEGWLALFSPDAKQFKRATDPDQLANLPSTKAYDQASRRKAYEAAFAATPHGRADIFHTISVGDLVAARGSFTFPDQVIHTLTIYRIRDGLIHDIWDVEQVKTPAAAR
jgi:hypothetical protein